MYTEINPHKDLEELVQSFWTMQTEAESDGRELRVVPDGCFDIIIYITPTAKNNVRLTGIWDQTITVSVPAGSNIVGVRFYPASINLLLTITLASIRNQVIPLQQDMCKYTDEVTLEPLFTSNEPDGIIDFLEAYLLFIIERSKYNTNTFFNMIRKIDTSIGIKEISKDIGISDRHLTRQFNTLLGIPTKTYLSILRFIKAKELLRSNSTIPYAHIAIECGYYDQSHFIREFKKYSGKTPKQYIS